MDAEAASRADVEPNVDPAEIAKFAALASRWWDPESEFKPLHELNPLRLEYIECGAGGLTGKRVLDVGCGGGILAESMARCGAQVCGIDMAQAPLDVARLHALEAGVEVDYRESTAESLAAAEPGCYDIVTCMEMLEHVPAPGSVVAACAALLKPSGRAFFSTLNRNGKSFLFAIVGAEYLLGLLPKGTHEYAKLIRPSELDRFARNAELQLLDLTGVQYQPLQRRYVIGSDVAVNYLASYAKPPASTATATVRPAVDTASA